MKKQCLMIGIALLSVAAMADSDGTRGGGQAVIGANGVAHLRDLVDPSVCDYKTGNDLRRSNPEVNLALGKIAKLDWYFAAGLQWELDHLQICFTDNLILIPAEDKDSVIAYDPLNKKQAAVRFLNSWDVYVNSNFYSAFSNTEKAFLLIHESIHSFISIHAPHRNDSVSAAVKALSEAANGQIMSPRQFHNLMALNSVDYPWVSNELSQQRQAIQFALGSDDDRLDMLLNVTDLNSIFALNIAPINNLIYPDQRETLAQESHPGQSLADHVSDLIGSNTEDWRILDRVLTLSSNASIDPLLIALSAVPAQGSNFQNHVLASPAMAQAMKSGFSIYARMKQKGLKVDQGRIIATGAYSLLGQLTSSAAQTPALSVVPLTIGGPVPSEIQGLMNFIVLEAQLGNWSTIQSLVSKNNDFYASFGITDLQAQLQKLNPPIAREKADLNAALPEMVRGFRTVLLDQVTKSLGADVAQRVDSEINWARLGLII